MLRVCSLTRAQARAAAAGAWEGCTSARSLCESLLLVAFSAVLAGCTQQPPSSGVPGEAGAAQVRNEHKPAPATRNAGGGTNQCAAAQVRREGSIESAADLVAQAEKKLNRGDLEGARALLEQAEKQSGFGAVREAALELEARLGAADAERRRSGREAALERASELLAAGDLENALSALEAARALEPTPDERAQVDTLMAEIERRRRVRRKLLVAIQLLGSSQRSEVRAAQSELFAEPDVAIPLLLQAAQSDQPTLVANALEMLRRLNQPAISLPAMVGVLSRPEQQSSWPAAIRELARSQKSGAGLALLELANRSSLAEQRAAALRALAEVPDPPEQTLPVLLPVIEADGPETLPALEAAAHAVLVHDQQDLAARRGLGPLEPAVEDRLVRLATRLASLAARSAQDAELATAAARLALCTRLLAPKPLEGVTLASFSGELTASPAAAVLDGVWNSTSPETQWRLPASQRAAVVLDLGQPRLVCGVKVWNLNEPGSTHRGWRDVELFVSDSPAPLVPLAEGLVLQAPGAANVHDFGTYIPIAPTVGRYVKLQARTAWREDAYKGLAEVQVWGLGP